MPAKPCRNSAADPFAENSPLADSLFLLTRFRQFSANL
jgi:hypothetical protein